MSKDVREHSETFKRRSKAFTKAIKSAQKSAQIGQKPIHALIKNL